MLAVVGCVLAAGVLLTASELEWLRASIAMEPPLPDVRETFTGGEVMAGLVGIGIVVGAAGLALIATRWLGRLIIAVVLIVVGLLTLGGVGFFLSDDGRQTAWSWAQDYAAAGSSVFPDHEMSPAPAVVTILGAGIAVGVGAFTIWGGRRWPVMGARYQRPARSSTTGRESSASATVRPPASVDLTPESREAAMWSALERGEDPTVRSSDAFAEEAAEPPDQPVSGR